MKTYPVFRDNLNKEQAEQLLNLILSKCKRVDHFAVRERISEYLRKNDLPAEDFEMYLDHSGALGIFFDNNIRGYVH